MWRSHRHQVPGAVCARSISLAAHHKAADYTIAKLRLGVLEMALGTAVSAWAGPCWGAWMRSIRCC